MSNNSLIVSAVYNSINNRNSIANKTMLEDDRIRKMILLTCDMHRIANPTFEIDIDQALFEVKQLLDITINSGDILEDTTDHVDWLNDVQDQIEWRFWKRYKMYLEIKLATTVVSSIDTMTNLILSKLENPERFGSWDRRGLVVGDVQSGKTSNFIGLICKACDAGYKTIIVLSGQTDDLRSQTQKRIDLGLLGYDTSKTLNLNSETMRIGVGEFDSEENIVIHSLTSSSLNGDFSISVFRTANVRLGDAPVIFVVKKNASVLRNLLNELERYSKKDRQKVPLLLIDDEADYASINNKSTDKLDKTLKNKDNNPSTINRRIRNILNLFDKSSYVGYTATPYANIFIYPDLPTDLSVHGFDLFPRSFIINLPTPSNYYGPRKIFGLSENDGYIVEEKGLPLIREIKDSYDFSEVNNDALPTSMKNAIYSFLIVVSIRKTRGQGIKHNTMLIHIARLNLTQKKIYNSVEEFMRNIKFSLVFGQGKIRNNLLDIIKELYMDDYITTSNKLNFQEGMDSLLMPDWEVLSKTLISIVETIDVRLINSSNKDISLDYDLYPNGLNVIAIGGDKLSRGLTLEDLSVSYFTRESKMYDTLLQMGRWFGYKDGFIDLCRLYTTKELAHWYKFITLANEDLRDEFKSMSNSTPMEFGLKVRYHPSGMIVTSMNKMRSTRKISLTFSGTLVSTTSFFRKSPVNTKNLENLIEWLPLLGTPNQEPDSVTLSGAYIWNNVLPNRIIEFIENYNSHPLNFAINGASVSSYISSRNKISELTTWTVVLMSVKSEFHEILKEYPVGLSYRSDIENDETSENVLLRSNQLISESHESLDLTSSEIQEAWKITATKFKKNSKQIEMMTSPSPKAIRIARNRCRGLLIIYPLKLGKKAENNVDYDNIIIGYAVSFPESTDNTPTEFMANSVYYENYFNTAGGK